jgi:hypothetical protein
MSKKPLKQASASVQKSTTVSLARKTHVTVITARETPINVLFPETGMASIHRPFGWFSSMGLIAANCKPNRYLTLMLVPTT